MKVSFVGSATFEIKSVIRKSIVESLKFLGQKTSFLEVCVSFMTGEDIRDLNMRTRNVNKVTDVLSYPAFSLCVGDLIDGEDQSDFYGGIVHLGDMAICLDKAKEQAEEYDTTLIEEVSKLAVHSTLHLMGYDHIQDCDYKVMQPKEDEIRKILKTKKII